MYLLSLMISLITIIILMILFYNYMNNVVLLYLSLEAGKIENLPDYTPPVWMKDAWIPTWIWIERQRVIYSI